MRILLVEDELKVARFIRQGLEAEGYEVDVAADGQTGEHKATGEQFDLVILDVLLPKKNGFDILNSLRHDGIKVPVLMLTARSGTEDIIKGLDTGADDYLTKPFAFDELLARVRSLLRRGSEAKRVLKAADLELDTLSRKAIRKGRHIELTTREYTLLEFLMRKLGRLVTRDQLAKEVWGLNFDPGTNIVDVYINHLRKKIDQGAETKLIHTERGKGYFISDKNSAAAKR
ncbi:MAG: response regulator transcription factor [Ignavibacteriales bacterium]|nr:response regulator transcription factor [Ignavibacteriales bacterium]